MNKLVYVRFSFLAYSLRHTPSVARTALSVNPAKIQSSPLPAAGAVEAGAARAAGAAEAAVTPTLYRSVVRCPWIETD